VGFVVDRVALGQVFSGYFGFPCQFSFHQLPHTHHHLSSWTGTIGQIVAHVPSGLSHPTPRNNNNNNNNNNNITIIVIVSGTIIITVARPRHDTLSGGRWYFTRATITTTAAAVAVNIDK
jgi:hypothetical protein